MNLAEILQILLSKIEKIVSLALDQKQPVGPLDKVKLKPALALSGCKDLLPAGLSPVVLYQQRLDASGALLDKCHRIAAALKAQSNIQMKRRDVLIGGEYVDRADTLHRRELDRVVMKTQSHVGAADSVRGPT